MQYECRGVKNEKENKWSKCDINRLYNFTMLLRVSSRVKCFRLVISHLILTKVHNLKKYNYNRVAFQINTIKNK